eukprot:TRINITY_DN10044_c0_g4_i1.p1 TRINITY_DN10044_c0_g4~~TRINITY_DN10044_c0_g4_i1.p1  ORF type:complete len:358 (+),score=136.18 TRINITY_DN10044_c0_g4_i1:93-1076(+)
MLRAAGAANPLVLAARQGPLSLRRGGSAAGQLLAPAGAAALLRPRSSPAPRRCCPALPCRQRRCIAVGEQAGGEIVHDVDSNDPFQILGVTRYSSPADVNNNFRKLAMRYHPDRPDGDEAKFNKLMSAKEMVLLRLGEKDADEVKEDTAYHEPQFTYDEETTQWEYKRGKMRMYDDYVDTGVERQRMTVWLLQSAIIASVAWVLFENFVEGWMTDQVMDNRMNNEGRMFAVARRKEYEKAANLRLAATRNAARSGTLQDHREAFTVSDPFAGPALAAAARRTARTGPAAWLASALRFLGSLLRWLRSLLPPWGAPAAAAAALDRARA